jgi:hypothetical protein
MPILYFFLAKVAKESGIKVIINECIMVELKENSLDSLIKQQKIKRSIE